MARKIKTKKFKKDGTIGAFDYKFTGEEPTWKDWKDLSLEEFQNRRFRIFTFYAYYLDGEDYKAILDTWMKANGYSKKDIAALARVPKTSIHGTAGKVARALNMGMPAKHPKEDKDYAKFVKTSIRDMITDQLKADLTKETEVAEDQKKKPRVVPIEERVDAEIISHLEYMLDEWFGDKKDEMRVKCPDVLQMMSVAQIPTKLGVPLVLKWVNRHLDEFKEAYDRTDKEAQEGYAFMKRPALRNRINELLVLITTLQTAKPEKAAKADKVKVPRKKKEKPPEKLIVRLKFMDSSKEYGDSIDPLKIIGASEVVLFNTKYRTFSHYYASPGKGLTVQGSSIRNFDPDNSYTMSLRKPLEVLPVLRGNAKGKILNIVKKLTTKARKANGRVNDLTLIINALK